MLAQSFTASVRGVATDASDSAIPVAAVDRPRSDALSYLASGWSAGGRFDQNNANFVANGSRNSTSDVILDGASVTNVEQNSGSTQLNYTPSVDAVQEFKVRTNLFSAEFGDMGDARACRMIGLASARQRLDKPAASSRAAIGKQAAAVPEACRSCWRGIRMRSGEFFARALGA